jgi:methylenetetrahydrofolate reductase (NADH)
MPIRHRGSTRPRTLREKSRFADYVTTQMCFDPDTLRRWVIAHRERGIELPVLIGLPGEVSRHRLLELSVRIGVGPSLAFVRKHHGVRSLLSRRSPSDALYDELVATFDDSSLDVAGFHYYTFNHLLETWRWQHAKRGPSAGRTDEQCTPSGYVPGERATV